LEQQRPYPAPDDTTKQPSDAYLERLRAALPLRDAPLLYEEDIAIQHALTQGQPALTRDALSREDLESLYWLERTEGWLDAHAEVTETTGFDLARLWLADLDTHLPFPQLSPAAQQVLERYTTLGAHLLHGASMTALQKAGDRLAQRTPPRVLAEALEKIAIEDRRRDLVLQWAWQRAGLIEYADVFYRPTTPPPPWVLTTLHLPAPEGTGASTPAPHVAHRPALPAIPQAFHDGMASIPSCLPAQGILAAIHHGADEHGTPGDETPMTRRRWQRTHDGLPYFTWQPKKGAGQIATYLRPEDTTVVTQDVADLLWQKARGLKDHDGDVLLACLVQAMHHRLEDGTTWISADAVLRYRGIQPIMKHENGQRRRAGQRTEDIAQVAASMANLETLWVQVREINILEARDGKKPKPARFTHESRVLAITDRITQGEEGSAALPIAWRFKPGTWLEPFLAAPYRQTALMMQKTLEYDPYRQKWEKRLARYATFHLRMNVGGADQAGEGRQIGTLLDELNLPLDTRHPERTKARLHRALDHLVRDGVIGGWDYTKKGKEIAAALPARGWLEDWLTAALWLTPPPALKDHYAPLTAAATQAARDSGRRGAAAPGS